MLILRKYILILICFVITQNLFSQKRTDPWNLLVERQKCSVSFIFYSKADNYNNGIVIKIHNKNKYKIKYRFTIIVKTDSIKKEKVYSGIIKAGEVKTGSNSKLFWIPKLNGRSIAEVGIKKWKFTKI